MKKIITLFAVFGIVFGSFSIAQAHFLATNNDIGGIIHIDPDDNPIVGKKSNIFIDLKDQKNRLKAGGCDCVLKVLKNDQEISSSSVSMIKGKDESLFVSSSFVFPEKAIYTIRLEGKSKTNSFENFTLNFDFFVEKGQGNEWYNYWYIWIGMFGIILTILWFLIRKNIG
jgi:hypothetical protein